MFRYVFPYFYAQKHRVFKPVDFQHVFTLFAFVIFRSICVKTLLIQYMIVSHTFIFVNKKCHSFKMFTKI